MGGNLLELSSESLLRMPEVESLLHTQPEPRTVAAKLAQAYRHLRRHGRGAGKDAMEGLAGDSQLTRRRRDRQTE